MLKNRLLISLVYIPNVIQNLIFLFVLLFFSFENAVSSPVCFDEKISDFILETKQILIPEYPDAFNPSILRWKGKLLLSFRKIIFSDERSIFPCGNYTSYLGLVWLNEKFEPVGKAVLLDLSDHAHSMLEDARLVIVGEELYLIYSEDMHALYPGKGCRVCIAIIDSDEENFFISHKECLNKFDNEYYYRYEKNWTPFDYYGSLLLSYQINPHTILFPLIGTNSCDTFALSSFHNEWQWGDLRGGTPALLVDGEYLSFFHSSKEMATVYSDELPCLHYFIGAYTFSAAYPFSLRRISPFPLIEKDFYRSPSYTPYWKPIRAVFPCGMFVEGNDIWVSYGKQDHEMWVMRLDKKGLMESLVPVSRQ